MSRKKVTVYTAIYGRYDHITEPSFISPDVEYICFTDDATIKSKHWEIRHYPSIFSDPNRNAKRFKILPHRYLDSDMSVWVDGNILIRKDPKEFLSLMKKNSAILFSHNDNLLDARNCIYDEYETIMHFGQINGNYKDDPKKMTAQIQKYKEEGFPSKFGLIASMIMGRRHTPEVCKLMEDWWVEIDKGSRRDQLSFDYVRWKNNFTDFQWAKGLDSRTNPFFQHMGKHIGKK